MRDVDDSAFGETRPASRKLEEAGDVEIVFDRRLVREDISN
jgi:hypothetical protein